VLNQDLENSMVKISQVSCTIYPQRPKPEGWKTMIRDALIAQQISDLMIEFQSRLNSSIVTVKEKCSSEEFIAYRRAVGKTMGEMLLEVMNPLYVEHPSLKPSGLE
jgi:hypothetical protein